MVVVCVCVYPNRILNYWFNNISAALGVNMLTILILKMVDYEMAFYWIGKAIRAIFTARFAFCSRNQHENFKEKKLSTRMQCWVEDKNWNQITPYGMWYFLAVEWRIFFFLWIMVCVCDFYSSMWSLFIRTPRKKTEASKWFYSLSIFHLFKTG